MAFIFQEFQFCQQDPIMSNIPPPPYAAPPSDKMYPNAELKRKDLENRQYVLVVDKSASMSMEDTKDDQGNERSRWADMQEAVLSFAEVMDGLDPDGIDFCLFNDTMAWLRGVHKADIAAELKLHYPRSGTLLSPVIRTAFQNHFNEKKGPTTVVIITDGRPSDTKEVIEAIKYAAMHMSSDEEFGIQIIQIGRDKDATNYLNELDDNIQEKYGIPYDIVDTTPVDKITERGGLKQALMNAIND